MLNDGLLDRFPCDALYAIHNRTGLDIGRYAIAPGRAASGGAFFDITVRGQGSHGAHPQMSVDPVLAASQIISSLQSVIARNVPPSKTAVLSITQVHAGDAYNVIPQTARIAGTARAFETETMTLIEERLRRIAEGVAAGFGATAEVDFRLIFAPLHNDPAQATAFADAAAELVGEAAVKRDNPPAMGSEDFSFMAERVPSAYILVGQGHESGPAHSPTYNYNDAATPYGAAVYARAVERALARGTG